MTKKGLLVSSLILALFISIVFLSPSYADEAQEEVENAQRLKREVKRYNYQGSLFVIQVNNPMVKPDEIQKYDRVVAINGKAVADTKSLPDVVAVTVGQNADLWLDRNGTGFHVMVPLQDGKLQITFSKTQELRLKGESGEKVPLTKTAELWNELATADATRQETGIERGELILCPPDMKIVAPSLPSDDPSLVRQVCIAEGDHDGELWWTGKQQIPNNRFEPKFKPTFYLCALGLLVAILSGRRSHRILIPATALSISFVSRLIVDFAPLPGELEWTFVGIGLLFISIIGQLIALGYTICWMTKGRR